MISGGASFYTGPHHLGPLPKAHKQQVKGKEENVYCRILENREFKN